MLSRKLVSVVLLSSLINSSVMALYEEPVKVNVNAAMDLKAHIKFEGAIELDAFKNELISHANQINNLIDKTNLQKDEIANLKAKISELTVKQHESAEAQKIKIDKLEILVDAYAAKLNGQNANNNTGDLRIDTRNPNKNLAQLLSDLLDTAKLKVEVEQKPGFLDKLKNLFNGQGNPELRNNFLAYLLGNNPQRCDGGSNANINMQGNLDRNGNSNAFKIHINNECFDLSKDKKIMKRIAHLLKFTEYSEASFNARVRGLKCSNYDSETSRMFNFSKDIKTTTQKKRNWGKVILGGGVTGTATAAAISVGVLGIVGIVPMALPIIAVPALAALAVGTGVYTAHKLISPETVK